MSVAVFVYFKSVNWGKIFKVNSKWSWLVFNMSRNSLGIYVMHPFVLSVLKRVFNISTLLIHPLLGITIAFITTALISFLLSYTMQRLPVLQRLVP
jgi:surface polysaccharide O-acyltransferase-like enzyme